MQASTFEGSVNSARTASTLAALGSSASAQTLSFDGEFYTRTQAWHEDYTTAFPSSALRYRDSSTGLEPATLSCEAWAETLRKDGMEVDMIHDFHCGEPCETSNHGPATPKHSPNQKIKFSQTDSLDWRRVRLVHHSREKRKRVVLVDREHRKPSLTP